MAEYIKISTKRGNIVIAKRKKLQKNSNVSLSELKQFIGLFPGFDLTDRQNPFKKSPKIKT